MVTNVGEILQMEIFQITLKLPPLWPMLFVVMESCSYFVFKSFCFSMFSVYLNWIDKGTQTDTLLEYLQEFSIFPVWCLIILMRFLLHDENEGSLWCPVWTWGSEVIKWPPQSGQVWCGIREITTLRLYWCSLTLRDMTLWHCDTLTDNIVTYLTRPTSNHRQRENQILLETKTGLQKPPTLPPWCFRLDVFPLLLCWLAL